jgi:outer membrane lipoprotein carrier protein
MRKLFSVIAFLFVLGFSASAQNDPKAQTVLDAMSKKYKDMPSFKAKFSFTLVNTEAKVKETSEGDIEVKGAKFHLKMGNQEIYNNGTTVWTYLKDANEVNISSYEPEENEVTPTKIYTLYKKGYKYHILKEEIYNGVAYDVIELNPEDVKKSKFFKIKIEISKIDKSVRSWKIYEKNGSVYTYMIKSFTPNLKLEDTYFNFDKTKYAGVTVEDLR